MLATLLLLAQLVLPGPPSGPIQPPGMICLGACAGPVVWGPAERGRLVVACDMTSDTCSDGRKITTTRATPVPCEVAPGVWEMVPENTGCYSVRGLESWAQTTSYLAYGAELDRSVWFRYDGLSVAARDGAWEIMRNRVSLGAVYQELLGLEPVDPEEWTASCVMKAGTTSAARLGAQRSLNWATIQLTENWHTYSVTRTVQPGQPPGLFVGPNEDQKSILVAGCWLTRTSTPGRPCWGGEAPVTCAADSHTISTEGWPTESGEISFAFQLDEAPSGTTSTYQYILDSRVAEESSTFFAVRGDGRFFVGGGVPSASPVTWVAGQTYAIRVRAEGGVVRVWRNGVLIHEAAGGFVWGGATARLGARFTNTQQLNGSISSLTVRSYEEVSP